MFFENIFHRNPITPISAIPQTSVGQTPSLKGIEEDVCFSITARQFAHRLVPAYLDGTEIVGTSSLASANHWIELIALWNQEKALPLPLKISKKHLCELSIILQDYAATLRRYSSVGECQVAAVTTLEEIKQGLHLHKVHYTPLGYREGVNNNGHAIPLKLRARGKQIEALALNLGEGVHMHPQLDWNVSGGHYHFQSFPAMIETETLFSERGIEALSHLILLQTQQCPAQVRGYSAEDVYGVLYMLGKIHSSFDSKLVDRSSKPQLGDICADMAIVLVVKDVLIDRGYSKEDIRCLFCLEKLCDILFFYRDLKENKGTVDLWTLLKNGLQEFAIHSLNNQALTQKEVEHIHMLLKPITQDTRAQIKGLKKTTLGALTPQLLPESFSCYMSHPKYRFKTHSLIANEIYCGESVCTPPLTSPNPEHVLAILQTWVKAADDLIQKVGPLKAHQFVYKAMSFLPIPHPKNHDFWDLVPEEAIEEIATSLALLANLGICNELSKNEDRDYPQIFILLIGYAIVDKLARRKGGEYLNGFASPFYPSRFNLFTFSDFLFDDTKLSAKDTYFEFLWLPVGPLNIQWHEIRYYFETIQAQSTYTLFALGSSTLNIEAGVKEFRKKIYMQAWSSVHSHLKFLEPFLEKLDQQARMLPLEEQFITLWMNEDGRYIPPVIETLYYLAHTSWQIFRGGLSLNNGLRVHRAITQVNHISIDAPESTVVHSKLTALGCAVSRSVSKCIDKKWEDVSENATQCMKNEIFHRPIWNTSLYRQWARIFSTPALQITSVIQWMRSHISLLCESEIQQMVEIGLFQPGLLTHKINHEKAILDHLRNVIAQGIDHFRGSHTNENTCHFLVRLGLCVETYTQASLTTLEGYEQFLLMSAKSSSSPYSLYCHLLFLYQIGLPRGKESLRELIKAQFWILHDEPSEKKPPPWLLVEISSPLQTYHAEIASAFEDKAWGEKTFAEVLHLLLPETPLSEDLCLGHYPILTKGHYRLNVETGVVYHNSHQLLYLTEDVRLKFTGMKNNRLVWLKNPALKGFGIPHHQGWRMSRKLAKPASKGAELPQCRFKDKVFYSADGLSKIAYSLVENKSAVYHRFPNLVGYKDKWFCEIHMDDKWIKSCYLMHSPSFDYWRCHNEKCNFHLIVICKKGEYQPLYMIEESGTSRVLKLRSQGNQQIPLRHLQLVNTWKRQYSYKPHKDTSLIEWFKRLAASKEACVWVNHISGNIEELDLIDLEVSFKEETGRFRCLTFPDFFLADEQSLDALDHFEGALVLENSTKTCVLLPIRPLRPQDDNFSTEVIYKEGFLNQDPSGSKTLKVYLYELDPLTGDLVQPDAAANLYLTLLFAMKRNYEKALRYLEKTRTFCHMMGALDWIIQPFYDLKDHSPEALAFYLRYAIHLIRNAEQVILEGYGYKGADLPYIFYLWTAKHYTKYLRVQNIKQVSRIPAHIRLTHEDELFLLKNLHRALTEEDKKALSIAKSKLPKAAQFKAAIQATLPQPHWIPLFDIRQKMLQAGNWIGQISPTDYSPLLSDHVFHLATDFSQINKHFPFLDIRTSYQPCVRFTTSNLRKHFMTLYERARQGKGEFDLFFLMRSGELGENAQYVQLLRYVLCYPDRFQGLDFGPDQATNLKVFEEIIGIGDGILAHLWQQANRVQTWMGSHSIHFDYQKPISLTLHKPPALKPLLWRFDLADVRELQNFLKTVDSYFLETYLEFVQEAYFKQDSTFVFSKLDLDAENPTTQDIVTRLQAGHAQLLQPRYGKKIYQLKQQTTLSDCLKAATHLLETRHQKAAQIKEEAQALANSYPQTAYRLGLGKMGADLTEITMDGILTQCYLAQNITRVRMANPSLEPKQLYRLMLMTIHYHLLRIQMHQLERGIVTLQKTGSIQMFAESIAVYEDFDPTAEPEMILYQSRTGKSLRKQQADLLTWEIETTSLRARKETTSAFGLCEAKPNRSECSSHPSEEHHSRIGKGDEEDRLSKVVASPNTEVISLRALNSKVRLFVAPAGEGKTTLYIPIAMKRLQRGGFVPFSASSKALYRIDREGLKATSLHVFSFEIDVLELALSTHTTAADFQWFYERLVQSPQNGYKLTPEVYYALALNYQLALEQKSVQTVYWLRRIFAYFKEKGAILVDECRQNCSPFTQAKIGIGKPVSLPPIDCKTLLEIYRLLMSTTVVTQEGRTIQETVGLQDNLQATMSQQELKLVKEAVLKQLINETDWLKNKSIAAQQRAFELIHIYFEEFFNTAMSLVWRMHHVQSIKHGEDLHVPARTRQATRSNFDDIYLTLIATIHGIFQEGIQDPQALKLFEELEKTHISEVGSSTAISEIETLFGKWVGVEGFRLSHFSMAHPESRERFHRLVERNGEVIFWLLEHVILKQAQYSPEQISVTPVHFLHAFNQTTLFSADPGPRQIYGIYDTGKHIREDPTFLAHAVQQFLSPENSQFITFPHLDQARTFFDALLKENPSIFSHLRMICDAGGMLRNFTVTECVSSFFEMLKEYPHILLDGLIMFEEASDKEEETRLFLWMKDTSEPQELNGHDIPAALSSLGLNWEKLNLLTIIDPSHRAGANIEQPKGSSVLALLGEELTLSDDAQGKLRGRGVLKNEQRIIWGVSQKLAPLISDHLNPTSTLEWEMRNESKMIDKEILLSAFQQIDYWIEEPVRRMLLSEDDPQKQIAIWKRYRQGFVKQVAIDPIARFKGKRARAPTEKVLWDYAKQKYGSFQFDMPWDKAAVLCRTLSPIIRFVAKRQPQLFTTAHVDSRQHATIFTFQKEEMKKEQITSDHINLVPVASLPLPEGITISSSTFVTHLISHSRSVQEVFGSSHLTHGLYFTRNALCTAKMGETPLQETYLKPVQYFLLLYHKNRLAAFALSDTEASFFQNALINKKIWEGHLALLSADGQLVQNGLGTSRFTSAMLNATFIQDIVIDIGLARCTLLHPLRFIERIEKWDDFWPMWEKIKKWQPLPHFVHAQGVEKHVPERIKKWRKPQSTNFSSFFGSFKLFS